MSASSEAMPWRWLDTMILFTFRRPSLRTERRTTAARSSSISMLGPGEEIEEISGVVRPITPIRSPPRRTIVQGLISRRTGRSCGSALMSRFADRNVVSDVKPSMKSASAPGPKSKSWFPSVIAS